MDGAPPPAVAPGDTVTYVFHVGLNSGTSPHRFELQLDGRPVATFDTSGGTANREWTVDGKDGARLRFVTTRLGGFDERFGFMALSLPRRALGDGAPRFRLLPEAAGSQDYVLVFEEPVRAWRGRREEAVLKGGRRMLTAEVSHLGAPGRSSPPRAGARSPAAASTSATRGSRSACPRARRARCTCGWRAAARPCSTRTSRCGRSCRARST